jgi:hypothetical protein
MINSEDARNIIIVFSRLGDNISYTEIIGKYILTRKFY